MLGFTLAAQRAIKLPKYDVAFAIVSIAKCYFIALDTTQVHAEVHAILHLFKLQSGFPATLETV